MTPEVQSECLLLLGQYNRWKTGKRKRQARDELFLLLKPYMIRWIKGVFRKWRRMEDEKRIISLSWRAFLYCLERYNGNYPLPFHFHNYTKYYLLTLGELDKEERIREYAEEIGCAGGKHDSEEIALCSIVDLSDFRRVLPEEYKPIFDDALYSLHPARQMRQTNMPKGICRSEYYGAKKALKYIVKFLLGENSP